MLWGGHRANHAKLNVKWNECSCGSLCALSPVSSVSADSVPECSCKCSAGCSHTLLSSGLLQTWEEALQHQINCHDKNISHAVYWSCPVRAAHLVWMFLHLFCLVVFWRELERSSPRIFSSLCSLIQVHPLTSSVSFSFLPPKKYDTPPNVQHGGYDSILSHILLLLWYFLIYLHQ